MSTTDSPEKQLARFIAKFTPAMAAQAKGLSPCFLQGVGLPDPQGLLRGSGNIVRSIRLESAETLDRPAVRALMKVALARAGAPIPSDGVHRLVITSVSAMQRPRRPQPVTKP